MSEATEEYTALNPENAAEAEPTAPEPEPKKSSNQILQDQILEGLKTLEEGTFQILISAIAAGLEIGFSLFLMAVMLTETEGMLPQPVIGLMVANMYAIGFIFVILGRSELFTEQTTLVVLPVLNGKASLGMLMRQWVIVLFGNLVGATLFALMAVQVGPALGDIDVKVFGTLANEMVEHDGSTIFLSAVLAGWLMGLMSWLVAASRDTISQIVVVWVIATAIGFAGFHHVIAGSVEVLAGLFAGQDVTIAEYGKFLLWTTLGNVLGGVFFVAVIKYGYATARHE